MKKSTVRIFAIVLVVLMCLSLLPLAAAHAEEHVHVFEPTTIPPTCGEEGYVQMICEACGFGTDIVEYLPPTGNHVFDNIVGEDYLFQDSDNFCEIPQIYWKACIVCGAAAEESYEIAKQRAIDEMSQRKANGEQHSDEEWQTMLQRMLDEIWANYTFSYGGEGHQWVDVEYQPATCEQDGWETYHVCAVCGKEPEVIPYIPATGHRWGEYTVISEPTCDTDGARTHVCSVCNKEETEAIPALGHTYGEYTVTKDPTCTEDGTQERICSVYDAIDTDVIPALGHKFGAFVVTVPATCTVDGIQEHTCTVCGEKETEAIPAAHKFGEYVMTVEPGCYSSGEMVRTCTVCGETESMPIPPEHKYGEFVVTMEPTCYSTGERRSTCQVCGEEIVEWIDMAHKYENGVCVFCGEADPNYDPNAVSEEAQEPEDQAEASAAETESSENAEAASEAAQESEEKAEASTAETESSENAEAASEAAQESEEKAEASTAETESSENAEAASEAAQEPEEKAEVYNGEVTVAQTKASEDVVNSFMEAAKNKLGLTDENTVGISVQNVTPYKADGTELADEEIPEEGITFEMDIPEGFDPENQEIEIYHCNKDGVWEKMEIVEVKDGKVIVWKERSFSPFALTVKRLDDQIAFVAKPASDKKNDESEIGNFELLISDTDTFDNAEENEDSLISDISVFDSGSELFDTPILQKAGVQVSEAVSGDTLTVYIKATSAAPADQTYQYRWIRDTGSTHSIISGATGSTYRLTDDDCGSSIYCSVNVAGKPNEAELSTGVHARKEISMNVTIRPVGGAIGGSVKIEFTDTLHPEYKFEPITYPEYASNSFTINTIRDINGVEKHLMSEDSLTITVEPAVNPSETQKGYYVRYVAHNNSIIINATSQKSSYSFESLEPDNDEDVISVFFDLAECQPNEKKTQGPTTESDQQLHNNTKLWEEFESKYVQKPDQDTPFPVVYYYVTPKWLGAPAVPMVSSEIKAVGGFTFKLGLPVGVTSENYNDYDVRVYHYVTDKADWEKVYYSKVDGENTVQITNFTNFSPFAVVARPTAKVEFVNLETDKGSVSNTTLTADDKGDVVLPKAEFTAQDGYTFACWMVDGEPMLPGETVHGVFEDKKVYPKWLEGFTITFDDNDADNQSTYGALVTGTMDKQTVFKDKDGYHDYKGNLLDTVPTLNKHAYQLKNHDFLGWSDKPGSSDNKAIYTDQQSVADVKPPYELYAVWKRNSVSVMFNANGGSGKMEEQKGPAGSNITLNPNTFEAPDENKVFAGWSITSDGNVDFKDKQTIVVPSTDLPLYAVWREKVIVKYNPKSTSDTYGGTGTGTAYYNEFPSGATVTLPQCRYTAPEGKAFAFWSDRQDGTGTKYPDRYEGYWTGNTELFAQWGDKLSIHYNPNGGDGTNKVQIVAQNVDVTLATAESTGFSRSGYKFLGWDTISSKKSNPKYQGGETVKGGFDQADITLYAIWEQVEITGDVVVTGTLSGIDSLGFVGETLEAEIFNEKKYTDFTYEWIDEDGNVLGKESTYTPTKKDFGKTIVCTVTAHSPEEKSKTSNEKTIGIAEEDKRIINNGETEIDYVYGLYSGMYYSTDGGKNKLPVSLDSAGRFPLKKSGVYYFYANNTDNTILAVVNVENWWTIGYSTSGSGTVRLMLDSTTLTSGTRFNSDLSPYIEYYPKMGGYTCWIVKEGASIGTFTLTVSPSSSNYAHVYLNEKLLDSFGSGTSTTSSNKNNSSSSSSSSSSSTYTHTYTVGTPLDTWKLFDVVFNNSSTSPRTADVSHLGLWSALCLVSLTGAATILGKTFKRRKSK